MAYQYIYHPETGVKYSIQSTYGKVIINNYLQLGGKITLQKLLNKGEEPLQVYHYNIQI